MAWPDPATNVTGVVATWDKTSNTFDRDVDSKLWPALMAKSPILDMLARPKVSNFKFEWETDVAPTRTYTSSGTAGADDINADSAVAGDEVLLTLAAAPSDLQVGSLIRNATRATPIGSYAADEVMEVTGINSAILTVVRDAGRQAAGVGSLVHDEGDVFEVIYAPREEGSAPGVNKYKDVTLVENYANTVDFYLTATGDQLATDKLVAADNMQNQFQKALHNLTNQLEGMFFYGCLNNGANAGSISAVRRTKGFDAWVGAANGNYDVTTAAVTPAALDNLFYQILADSTDPADRFVIACHPKHARTISSFGIDKIRMSQEDTKYGRHIDTFKSDLGVEAPIIWSLNVSKSDLFIIDMNKVSMPTFRPFEKAEWSYGDDGVDAYRQRILGSFGVKVVDGLYSHAKLGGLPWT